MIRQNNFHFFVRLNAFEAIIPLNSNFRFKFSKYISEKEKRKPKALRLNLLNKDSSNVIKS